MDTNKRFWSKVDIRGADDCWEWKAFRDQEGYGQFYLENRTIKAPRAAYRLAIGEIPSGEEVCHTCDNPPCCNPNHLFLGAHRDNMDDMMAKGRQNQGDRHGMARLNCETVAAIRWLYHTGESKRDLARRFGVDRATILRVVRNNLWTHC